MDSLLTVVGGTYFERCDDPPYYELYGSGLRAAAALSGTGVAVQFSSCVGAADVEVASSVCDTFGIEPSFELIKDTVTFHYYHPLSVPEAYPDTYGADHLAVLNIAAENVLYYGMIEASAKVTASYLVYDPQNHIGFKETGSVAKHLALVLNRKEAVLLSELPEDSALGEIGSILLESQGAEVVVIKNGSQGAAVIDNTGVSEVPVFKTSAVWPIGSGDIFSAVFAWKWMLEKLPAIEAAQFASKFTAHYCQYRALPLPAEPDLFLALPKRTARKVYLAGPFFTMSDRWMINELRNALLSFGNEVFSPWHDVGMFKKTSGTAQEIASKDLKGIHDADVLLVLSWVNQRI